MIETPWKTVRFPAAWKPGALRHFLGRNDGGVWGDEPSGNGDVPVVRSTDISLDGEWDLSDVALRNLKPNEMAAGRLLSGDVVVVKSSGSQSHLGKSAIVTRDVALTRACFSNFTQRLRVTPGNDPRYLRYFLNSRFGAEQQRWAGTTTTGLRNLSGSLLGDLIFPGPPPDVQLAIADSLDHETASIDSLIAKKHEMMTRLAASWEGHATRALTRGLKGELGQPVKSAFFQTLPPGWQLLPLKRRWSVMDCKHMTPAYVEHGVPVVSHPDILDGHVLPGRSGKKVSHSDYLNLIEAGRRPQPGDIIYTRNASIGNAGIVVDDSPFAMGQDVCLIRSKHEDQRFLTYFLNLLAKHQLEAHRLGATFARINVSQVLEIEVPYPPPEEQRQIADYLDRRWSVFVALRAKLRLQLEKLRERRQAIITRAVTGQLDVANVA